MTVAVTKTLVRLQVMTGEDATLNALVTKAFRFLDKEVARQVTELKKRKDFIPVMPFATIFIPMHWLNVPARQTPTICCA